MSSLVKFLIGLLAALAAGWIAFVPLGRGAAYLDDLETRAGAVVRAAAIPGVQVRMDRDPPSRTAILSGRASRFQREGIGRLPGLDDRVAGVAGVAAVRWDRGGGGTPLIVELLGLAALAYLLGVGIGWFFFRPRHEGYL